MFFRAIIQCLFTLTFWHLFKVLFPTILRQNGHCKFLSLPIFELTQLTGLYFIYPRPYRLFDVNDLLTNTFGGMLGYLVTPIFTFMLPTRARMDEVSYEKGKTVSLTRRLVAYLIDWFFLSICTSIIGVVAGLSIGSSEFTSYSWWLFVQVFLYFMLLPVFTNGRTLGKKSSGSSLLKMGGNESDFVHCSFDMRISISYFMG
ncbi:RDD family protein [Enterococcus mundtii]|nr:RDD family protein [Enterococcus mundtii]